MAPSSSSRVADEIIPTKLSAPRIFLIRMLVFLILCALLVVILYKQIWIAFLANPGLNTLIGAVMAIGTIMAFRQVIRLYPEIAWVNSFRIADPGLAIDRRPRLLAPMAAILGDRVGRMSITQQTMRHLLDSIGTRLDEARDISRYMTGLLVFLGLLGTFWGLIETVGSVGKVIDGLKVGGDAGAVFDTLKEGLAAPLGGMGTFIGMMLQCVFGGKGVGFLAALVYGIIGVFVAGLMVGHTPQFLGKKIEKPEIVLVSLTLLIHPLVILLPTGWSVVAPYGVAAMGNAAMHGYSEVLYAFTTSAANNGSAFAGLNANTPWYNIATAAVILLGRYPPIIFMMAVAGSVAVKPKIALTPGTLRTDTLKFGIFWLGTILVIGALTFVPALVLGPVAEFFAMKSGLLF